MDSQTHTLLQELVHQAHAVQLPQPLADKMVADLEIQLEQELNDLVFQQLSEVDQISYQNLLLNQSDQASMQTFLLSRIPDIQTQLAKCIADFQQTYITICQSE